MSKQYDFLIDFDTPLVSAAAVQQKDTLVVTHNKTGREKEFRNKTEFKQWLKENSKWNEDQFSTEVKSEIVGGVRMAVAGLMSQMHNIVNQDFVRTYKFVVGGVHGNFRDSLARIQPYKGQRPKKPLLFEKIKNELLIKASQYIIQPNGSYESDDVLSMFLFENNKDRAISFVDKDLKTVVGWSNSFKTMKPPEYTNEFEAFYNLALQSLTGDVADNIMGIPRQAEEVIKRFGLRKSKGFGKVSAEKCLKGAFTIEDIVERLVFVYQETFKDGLLVNDPWEKLNWLQVLDENIQLLKMLDYEGQQYIFSKEFNIKEN